jgi:hypothetical protein
MKVDRFLEHATKILYLSNVLIKYYLLGNAKTIDLSQYLNLVDKQLNTTMLLPALFQYKDKEYNRIVYARVYSNLNNNIE